MEHLPTPGLLEGPRVSFRMVFELHEIASFSRLEIDEAVAVPINLQHEVGQSLNRLPSENFPR